MFRQQSMTLFSPIHIFQWLFFASIVVMVSMLVIIISTHVLVVNLFAVSCSGVSPLPHYGPNRASLLECAIVFHYYLVRKIRLEIYCFQCSSVGYMALLSFFFQVVSVCICQFLCNSGNRRAPA